jgi:hypothetical protein
MPDQSDIVNALQAGNSPAVLSPPNADMIGQYAAALQKADNLRKAGMLSDPQHAAMIQQLMQLQSSIRQVPLPHADPRTQPPVVNVPMPKPDPRGNTWEDRITKTQDPGAGTDFPPEVLYGAKGLNIGPYQGDQNTYRDNPFEPWYNPIWGDRGRA